MTHLQKLKKRELQRLNDPALAPLLDDEQILANLEEADCSQKRLAQQVKDTRKGRIDLRDPYGRWIEDSPGFEKKDYIDFANKVNLKNLKVVPLENAIENVAKVYNHIQEEIARKKMHHEDSNFVVQMYDWHFCNTSHCIGGWVQLLFDELFIQKAGHPALNVEQIAYIYAWPVGDIFDMSYLSQSGALCAIEDRLRKFGYEFKHEYIEY